MIHNWYGQSGGGLIANLWLANALKCALLDPSFVPNLDTQKVFADVAAHEVVGGGGVYVAGGLPLANKATNYDAPNNRTNLIADNLSWGPGATFDAAYAVVYDNGGTKPLWSLIDFQGTKSVANGVFAIDWAAVGALYVLAP
jgi:hypothetical protein